ncbi:MAG: HAD-IIIA family hydrolase [bacterium]
MLDARNKALFLDLDGTIRYSKGGNPTPMSPDDVGIFEDVLDRLREYKDEGFLIFGISNRGEEVAFGLLTEEEVMEINRRTDELCGGIFNSMQYCPHHPEGALPKYGKRCECRKPKPGMAFSLRLLYNLDLSQSIMVGDGDEDREFAENAKIGKYYDRSEFFSHTAGTTRN